jgi:CRP/FNR family transcriptional regulator, cyclic AMP receptor protein
MDAGTESANPTSDLQAEQLALLKTVPLLQDIEQESDLKALLSGMKRVKFSANQRIFEQGDTGDGLYILLSGRVRVHLDEFVLAELSAGNCFGEMALFDAQPRSASVTAIQDSECWVLSQSQVNQMIHHNPEVAIALIRVLGNRLRHLLSQMAASEDLLALHPKHLPKSL